MTDHHARLRKLEALYIAPDVIAGECRRIALAIAESFTALHAVVGEQPPAMLDRDLIALHDRVRLSRGLDLIGALP